MRMSGVVGKMNGTNVLSLFAVLIGIFLVTGLISVTVAQQGEGAMSERFAADFKKLQGLEDEQKFQQALEFLDTVLERARNEKDPAVWTRCLTRKVTLRIALHGYETAVRDLHEDPWPDDLLYRSILHIFYANTLFTYYNSYSWEILQREKVISTDEVDLKKWTAGQIFDVMNQSLTEAWKHRELLGGQRTLQFREYITAGNYPEEIRGSLRDFLVYSWCSWLSNTVTWKPGQQQATYLLDFPNLIALPAHRTGLTESVLTDGDTHPVVRYTYLLDDLAFWHASTNKREAALEAQLERLRLLRTVFTRDDQRTNIIEALQGLLRAYESLPWWAVGQHDYASMVREQGDLVEAHRLAGIGYERFPKSTGGRQCFHLMKSIEAPEFSLAVMAVDRSGARSLQLTHRNMSRIYLRAYPVDFFAWIEQRGNYPGSYNWDNIRDIVHKKKPVKEWTLSLEDPVDYRDHKTFVMTEGLANGYYIIAGSAEPDFRTSDNKILATTMLISPYVTILSMDNDGYEVWVTDGTSGRGVPEATVLFYTFDYNTGPRLMRSLKTDSQGRVSVPSGESREWRNVYVIVKKGDAFSYDPHYIYHYAQQQQAYESGVFIFTDRSIYRPLQKLSYKIVAFQGQSDKGEFTTVREQSISVQFLDANSKEIERQDVKTNSFGSASGEFTVPTGRVLGPYRLIASYGSRPGYATVRVEEYKRPTFEVSIDRPEGQLSLNRDALVKGKAVYYFGLPVVGGDVTWRVTREPRYPWWYWWYYRGSGSTQAVEISAGKAILEGDGTFAITFTPTADPDLPGRESVAYSYRLSVDVTDEGGETRSTSSHFTIGYVAVTGSIALDDGFYDKAEEFTVRFTRSNLDGVPQAGKGDFELIRLLEPDSTVPDSEMPLLKPVDEKFIPGDVLAPRWQGPITLPQRLFGWKDGKTIRSGELVHGDDGTVSIDIAGLDAGAYRFRYRTTDFFGQTFSTQKEFLVLAEGQNLPIPFFLLLKQGHVRVGEQAVITCGSGFPDKDYYLEFYQSGRLIERTLFNSTRGLQRISLPITEKHRGGLSLRVRGVHDYQFTVLEQSIYVPWDNKELQLTFSTFRDKLRPGQKETWTLKVQGPDKEKVTAELLAYMYDRSLDFFVPHNYPSVSGLYPTKFWAGTVRSNLGTNSGSSILHAQWYSLPGLPSLNSASFVMIGGYGIGGPGRRSMRYREGFVGGEPESSLDDVMVMKSAAPASMPMPAAMAEESEESTGRSMEAKKKDGDMPREEDSTLGGGEDGAAAGDDVQLRSNFNETAFFEPHLLTDADGNVSIQFEVPDSVTSWKVYTHAITKDLKYMTAVKDTVTVKELMVRPYVPRFFREGDQADLKVVINNAGDVELKGTVLLTIIDPLTERDLSDDFGLDKGEKTFTAASKQSANVTWALKAPSHIGSYAFKVVARSGDLSDGELRPVPVLPSRMHLIQSRFATLKEGQTRVLEIEDLLKAADDPSLIHDKFVVTLDTQLIYGVLKALPYLVNYPYECVEQTLNRFLSTGIVTSLYDQYPPIKKMASTFSQRQTQLEPWKKDDPNRAMTLEETPWLGVAEGGGVPAEHLINVFDERIARVQRDSALEKLRKAQLNDGSFPWWVGGPPSPYMTLYLMYGFAKATEFGIEVPKDMVNRGWQYLGRHYRDYYEQRILIEDFGYEFVTFMNYVLSCYPEPSWYGEAFSVSDRTRMLEYSFKYWKDHNPYMKGYLTLTLQRMKRPADANLVLESIMDSAVTKQDQGTFWAPEDRGWLWYNDNIESHAFILRVLMEVRPTDERIDGMILWLMLNKKFNQWKSTRTTAEVIYSLTAALKAQGALAVREKVVVTMGAEEHAFVFEPDEYTGDNNQILVSGPDVDPAVHGRTQVAKEGKGFMFASVTWHYSTEKMPEEARGDYLHVERTYFLRKNVGKEMVLMPLAEGTNIAVGDQIEVQLSIRAKHQMEYVHLRDPRGAGFEPENAVSGYRWDLGIGWYQEVRDSGTNFFFEWLPQGEYTFKYRIRASMAGVFRIGPATLQSMYAPEFAAFSSGTVMNIQ